MNSNFNTSYASMLNENTDILQYISPDNYVNINPNNNCLDVNPKGEINKVLCTDSQANMVYSKVNNDYINDNSIDPHKLILPHDNTKYLDGNGSFTVPSINSLIFGLMNLSMNVYLGSAIVLNQTTNYVKYGDMRPFFVNYTTTLNLKNVSTSSKVLGISMIGYDFDPDNNNRTLGCDICSYSLLSTSECIRQCYIAKNNLTLSLIVTFQNDLMSVQDLTLYFNYILDYQ